MVTHPEMTATMDLASPAQVQKARDQAIALSYVQRKKKHGVIKEIAKETGISRRTIERAISRELAWAESQPGATQESSSPGA